MDRRATLAAFFGKTSPQTAQSKSFKPPVFGGLEPYTGPWNFETAAHLLRRAMFGPNYAQINQAVTDGLNATIAKLLTVNNPAIGPVNPGRVSTRANGVVNDPYVATGEPWVKKGADGKWRSKWYLLSDQTIAQGQQFYRRLTLRSWTMERIMTENVSVHEKMTVFWHNHFVTADTNEPAFEFRYITTLRENALGNFKNLVKQITLDPAMLFYLNGNENTNVSPNENYARELFELFTIGKGPLAGPGDYTNYTEEDIKQAAKVLTGWKVRGIRNLVVDGNNEVVLENADLTIFNRVQHDASSKTFSTRFNNEVIPNDGANEYNRLIDMIFNQQECARFICRKLYRWFVYYVISAEAEQNVIEPMAQLLIQNNWEVKPVLEALFKSQHFFDVLNMGPMIKNPFDFVFSMLKAFYYVEKIPAQLDTKHIMYFGVFSRFTEMQMVYFAHPDVAGWKAYYQEPLYYRIWINSSTLQARFRATDETALSVDNNGRPNNAGLDVLKFVSRLDNPTNPVSLIDESVNILFPRPIEQIQKDYLKEILLPGLPDYEWTIEYTQYLADPTNPDMRNAVESKLRQLYKAMLSMPEFYLS